ncbi:neuromedin-B receptor-like [Glandiceps talaboti]
MLAVWNYTTRTRSTLAPTTMFVNSSPLQGVFEMNLSSLPKTDVYTNAVNESNITDYQYIPPSPYLGPEAVIIPIIFAMIFFIGVIGNGTLVRIVLMNRNMRSVPNIFITSLALGDLLLLLVFVPFNAITYMTTSWPLGEISCKIMNSVRTASTGVSVFTLTALSADRYNAIVNPISQKASNKMRRTYVVSICIWFVSMLLGIPTLMYGTLFEYEYGDGTVAYFCQEIPLYMTNVLKIHTASTFVVLYLVPLSIISIYYTHIAVKLMRSSKGIPGEHIRHDRKRVRDRKRLAKVILVFVLIFLVCWLPYHVFYMMLFFSEDISYMQTYGMMFFKSLGTVLAYSNSCVNPLALYFLSNTFKAYYNKYILCCLKQKKQAQVFGKRYYRQTSVRYSPSRTVSRTTQQTVVFSV